MPCLQACTTAQWCYRFYDQLLPKTLLRFHLGTILSPLVSFTLPALAKLVAKPVLLDPGTLSIVAVRGRFLLSAIAQQISDQI